MKYLRFTLFFSLIAFFISGCSNNPVNPTESASNKYPLHLNNEWNYEITIVEEYGSGDKINLTKEKTTYWTVRVVAVNQHVETFSNVTFVEYSNTYDLDYRDTVYYINNDEGLFSVLDAGAIFTLSKENVNTKENHNQKLVNTMVPFLDVDYSIEDSKILLQYPLKPGSSWYEYSPHSPEDTNWLPVRTVQNKVNVETPAGSFSCFKVTRDFAYKASDYISLEFGLIKREVITNSEHMPSEDWFNETVTTVLTSVKIN